ncbi:transmembrane protein 186 [Xenentodon cancila]
MLPGVTFHVVSCAGGSRLLADRMSRGLQPPSPRPAPTRDHLRGLFPAQITSSARLSDLASQKYSVIYTLPQIKLLRAISRLKLLQTAITVVILPPVFVLYFQGNASIFLVGYATGMAVFAGGMLYTASHFFRRVVGMMYLDESQSTLKVALLTFWGKRRDLYLPVSDVMTIGDTGDSSNETILKFKRYSTPETLYFSTHYGRVVDKRGFEKVFGNLK